MNESKPRPDITQTVYTINNGFWDREPKDRAERMDRACEKAGVSDFFDLTPEERGRCYDEP